MKNIITSVFFYLLVGFASSALAAEPVIIGVYFPMTGPSAPFSAATDAMCPW